MTETQDGEEDGRRERKSDMYQMWIIELYALEARHRLLFNYFHSLDHLLLKYNLQFSERIELHH